MPDAFTGQLRCATEPLILLRFASLSGLRWRLKSQFIGSFPQRVGDQGLVPLELLGGMHLDRTMAATTSSRAAATHPLAIATIFADDVVGVLVWHRASDVLSGSYAQLCNTGLLFPMTLTLVKSKMHPRKVTVPMSPISIPRKAAMTFA
jgi:hypothetical protein